MNDTDTTANHGLVNRATGIHDLDTVTHGGLPAGGVSLVIGEPGCGKTIIGLQVLASALARGNSGVFMSFEESRDQILRNAETFRWGWRLRESSRCEISKTPALIQEGREELERLQEALMAEHHDQTELDRGAEHHQGSILKRRDPDKGGLDQ